MAASISKRETVNQLQFSSDRDAEKPVCVLSSLRENSMMGKRRRKEEGMESLFACQTVKATAGHTFRLTQSQTKTSENSNRLFLYLLNL